MKNSISQYNLAYKILNKYIRSVEGNNEDLIEIRLKKLSYTYSKNKNSKIIVHIYDYENGLIFSMIVKDFINDECSPSIMQCLRKGFNLGLMFTSFNNYVSEDEILKFYIYDTNLNILKL